MTSTATNFAHTHTAGLRVNLGGAEKPKVVSDKAEPTPSAYDESKSEGRRRGKKGKATVEEMEQKDAAIDSLVKANTALKVQAAIVKTDTVIKREVVIKRDTVIISLGEN